MRPLDARFAAALVAAVALSACGSPQPAASRDAANGAQQVAIADDQLPTMTVYRSRTCGCCKAWVSHVKEAGFKVVEHETNDLEKVMAEHGVPAALASCHTALVGHYVIEGHVPAGDIKKMLYEKPQIAGLAVPGMPMGSPGMEGPVKQAYDVFAFTKDGNPSIYASH